MSRYHTHFNEIKWSSGLIMLLEAIMCTRNVSCVAEPSNTAD